MTGLGSTTSSRASPRPFPHAPTRKLPLTNRILQQIAARANFSRLLEAQYVTMAFLAHDGLLRAAELLALRLCDVSWRDGYVCLRIHRSRANKLSHQPERVPIYPCDTLCGYSALRAYWRRMRFNDASPRALLFPSSAPDVPCPRHAWVAYVRGHLDTTLVM